MFWRFLKPVLYNSESPSAAPAHPALHTGCWGDGLGWSSCSLSACLVLHATGAAGTWGLAIAEWAPCSSWDGNRGALAPQSAPQEQCFGTWDTPASWGLLFHLRDPMTAPSHEISSDLVCWIWAAAVSSLEHRQPVLLPKARGGRAIVGSWGEEMQGWGCAVGKSSAKPWSSTYDCLRLAYSRKYLGKYLRGFLLSD